MARVDIEWYGDEVEKAVTAAAHKGLVEATKEIAKVSQDRVPVMTAELKRSQRRQTEGLKSVIRYEDNKAAVAHENPRKRKYRNEKREKFLESALNDGADDFVRTVAAEIRKIS